MTQRQSTIAVLAASIAVCLVFGTGAKPWVNKAAKQHRGGYPAHLEPAHDRPDSAGVVTFYAIGDWGDGGKKQLAVADLLRADLRGVGLREVRPFVLGTGDNYYPDGLPEGWPEDHVVGLYLDRRFGDVYGDCLYDGRALTFHVVHGNRRAVERQSYAPTDGGANQQCADQSGARGVGNTIDIRAVKTGLLQTLVDEWQ